MIKNKNVLITICARGGSKGVKDKNIRLIDEIPLIIYSLKLIELSSYVDDYIVSTDSKKIMDVVQKYGYEIHFKRPAQLSGDKCSRIDAIRHATLWAENFHKKKYDIIADLGVATPFKNSEDLDKCIEKLVETKASNLFSVNLADRNPYFNMVEVVNCKIRKVKSLPNRVNSRQTAPIVYSMNDAFNIFQRNCLMGDNPQFNDNTQIYVMPKERSIDIDEEIDLKIAQLLKSLKNTGA